MEITKCSIFFAKIVGMSSVFIYKCVTLHRLFLTAPPHEHNYQNKRDNKLLC